MEKKPKNPDQKTISPSEQIIESGNLTIQCHGFSEKAVNDLKKRLNNRSKENVRTKMVPGVRRNDSD